VHWRANAPRAPPQGNEWRAKKEKMIITVIVPPHEKKDDAIREFCVARAKDFARRFAGMSDR
jgi:hypothetical protein